MRRPIRLLALLACLAAPAASADLAGRPDVQRFIDAMVAEHGFGRGELEAVMREARLQPKIVEAISRPAESMEWHRYRPIFVTASRARQGAEFWSAHEGLLAAAEARYGVPAPVMVAILGVETRYGRHTGGYRVLDALSTLAFDYPPRADFFRQELEHYLLMTREEGIAPESMKGSYAGAMGQAQFIPSSFRAYAVDFDGDGRRDLWESAADAIGSIGHYLSVHGWQTGGPIARRARAVPEEAGPLVDRGFKPWTTVDRLAERGVTPAGELPGEVEAGLLRLALEDGAEHWVVLRNFYVITRYNHSPLYAMAVFQLSEAIRRLHEGGTTMAGGEE